MAKSIAVLITVHNRKDKTLRCLEKVYAHRSLENYDIDVFLTDDGSTDGTLEAVENLFPQVKVLHGDGTLFWNRGMNLAWTEATKYKNFDYFLWLNNDTILIDNAIQDMLLISEQKHNSIIVGTTIAFETTQSYVYTYGGRINNKEYPLIIPNGEMQVCSTFNGNCVLIPNVVYKSIGGLDTYFRHSFGDFEYGLRATKLGFNAYVMPNHIGLCDRNSGIPKYIDTKYTMLQRLNNLYSPLGFSPKEAFYMSYKYRSISYSIALYIKIHLNTIFPNIFTKNKVKQ